MCIHQRIIYSTCGHYAWGREVQPCAQQAAFIMSPATSSECKYMYSHPMHTVKVSQTCKVCHEKIAKTTRTTTTLRQVLKEIRESVERLEKTRKEGEAVAEAAADAAIQEAKKTLDDEDVDELALESWD